MAQTSFAFNKAVTVNAAAATATNSHFREKDGFTWRGPFYCCRNEY